MRHSTSEPDPSHNCKDDVRAIVVGKPTKICPEPQLRGSPRRVFACFAAIWLARPLRTTNGRSFPGTPSMKLQSERGAVIIHVAIALIALLGFTAVIVDYGAMWVARGQAQAAADAVLSRGRNHSWRLPRICH